MEPARAVGRDQGTAAEGEETVSGFVQIICGIISTGCAIFSIRRAVQARAAVKRISRLRGGRW
jgi:hypothetical protein